MRYMPGSSAASARYHAVEAVDPDDLDDYYEDDCEDNEELVTEKGRVQVGRSGLPNLEWWAQILDFLLFNVV